MIPFNNIREVWERNSKKFAENIVLFNVDENKSITYQQMYEKINQTSNLLNNLGLKKGSKIAFITSNIEEFFYLFYGAINIGAVACPINYSLTKKEINYLLLFCDAEILFVEKQFLNKVADIKTPLLRHKIGIRCDNCNKILMFENMIKKQPKYLIKKSVLSRDDIAFISFTSGTTGKPKGLVLTHNNLLIKSYYPQFYIDVNQNDKWLCTQQLYYHDQTTFFGIPFYYGAACVMPKKFSRTKFWGQVKKFKITYSVLFPTMAQILLKKPEILSKNDISKVKLFFITGSSVGKKLIKRFQSAFNIAMVEGYGLNETGPAIVNLPINGKIKFGSMGKPLPHTKVKIIDDNDNEVGPDEIGEIVIKSENVIKEYYKDKDLTKKTIKQGWIWTGDLGCYDKKGYFYFADRAKQIIKRGGESISPTEINNVILAHKDIENAVTFGVYDEIYGEEIKTCIVKNSNSHISKIDILDYCRQNLGTTKIPKYVEFLEKIPLSHTGKQNIKLLQKMHKD